METTKRGKGRPHTLSSEEQTSAVQRLEKLRAVLAHFPELKHGTFNRLASLPVDTFGRYLAQGPSKRQPMPAALDKLEEAMKTYIQIYDQK